MDERFKKIYIQEARELMQDIHGSLYTLQKNPDKAQALDSFYGSIHTLKSSSLEMGFSEVADLLHKIEDILQITQKNKQSLTEKLLSYLFSVSHFFEEFLEQIESGSENQVDTDDLLAQAIVLQKNIKDNGADKNNTAEIDPTGLSLFSRKIGSIRIDIERIDNMVNLVGELVIAKSNLLEQLRTYREDFELLNRAKDLDRLSRVLQEHILASRLVPLEYAINRFPGLVRHLSASSGKSVDITMEGQDIELDRAILDGISEPLVHLVKNAIDHGIETKEERKKKNKHPIAKLKIMAKRDRSYCVIKISDDGAGINAQAVLKKADASVPLDSEEALQKAASWIFRSGFSTARQVTEVSGRGVGLGFVKQRVESLGGKIKVESVPDEGTTFIINLPLSMAIVQALLIADAGERYAIPLTNVERTLDLTSDEINEVDGSSVIDFKGRVIRLVRLNSLIKEENSFLQRGNDSEQDEGKLLKQLNVVILRDESIGLVVDKLLGKREIVVKALDKLVAHVPILSGATILEDGRPAFILDIGSIVSYSNEKLILQ